MVNRRIPSGSTVIPLSINGALPPSLLSMDHPSRVNGSSLTFANSIHSPSSSFPTGFGSAADTMTLSPGNLLSAPRNLFGPPGVGYGVQTKSPSPRSPIASPSAPFSYVPSATKTPDPAKNRTASASLFRATFVWLRGSRRYCPGVMVSPSRRYGLPPPSSSSKSQPQSDTVSL